VNLNFVELNIEKIIDAHHKIWNCEHFSFGDYVRKKKGEVICGFMQKGIFSALAL
jgi:hypothetical protein